MKFGRTRMPLPLSTVAGVITWSSLIIHSVGWQHTQILNLNPIYPPVHLKFCFWTDCMEQEFGL